jgi:COP9 signalosome complex subunit 3
MSSIPSTVSNAASRAFKYLARPYEEFAQSLKNPLTTQEVLRTHRQIFIEDQNMGLIYQVLEQMEMKRIIALTETFVTISLEDVAKKVCGAHSNNEDIQRMEGLIVRMVFLPCLSWLM